MKFYNHSFSLQNSSCLWLLLNFIYFGAVICPIIATIPWLLKVVLVLFCLILYFHQYKKYFKLNKQQHINSIKKINKTCWQLTDSSNNIILISIKKSSVFWSWCLILHWQDILSQKNFTQLIFYDSLSKENFHLLKVLVRTAK